MLISPSTCPLAPKGCSTAPSGLGVFGFPLYSPERQGCRDLFTSFPGARRRVIGPSLGQSAALTKAPRNRCQTPQFPGPSRGGRLLLRPWLPPSAPPPRARPALFSGSTAPAGSSRGPGPEGGCGIWGAAGEWSGRLRPDGALLAHRGGLRLQSRGWRGRGETQSLWAGRPWLEDATRLETPRRVFKRPSRGPGRVSPPTFPGLCSRGWSYVQRRGDGGSQCTRAKGSVEGREPSWGLWSPGAGMLSTSALEKVRSILPGVNSIWARRPAARSP